MAAISRRNLLKSALIGAAGGVALGAFADLDTHLIKLERHTLYLRNWQADGFRVALLADVHVNDPEAARIAAKAAQMAVDEKPDLIVMAGDFVNSSGRVILDHIGPAFVPVSDCSIPSIAVMGNHDYWTAVPNKVIRTVHRDTNLRMLRNESVEVQGVLVTGLDDGIGGVPDYDLKGTAGHPSHLVAFHEPDFVDRFRAKAAIVLSGHSHGGQVCLPGGIPIGTSYGGRKYVSGFFDLPKAGLYVSRGIGTSGPDFRLFCPPEVTLLTLRSA